MLEGILNTEDAPKRNTGAIMHHIIKITPLLLGAVSLSACSALGLGTAKTAHNAADMSGTYTQTASNTHTSTMSDNYRNSGWYAESTITDAANPYAGGEVQIDMNPTEVYPADDTVKMAHTGYHDAYGNPVPAPSPASGPYTGPVDTTYVTPSLRGSYGPSYYGNIGGVMYDMDDEIFGVIARLGVQKEWYGAEVEGSFGVIDEELTANSDAGVDHSLAAFAVGRLPINKRLGALARVGYHTTQIGVMANANGQSVNVSDDFDGVAYGAGLEYNIDEINGLRFDYTRYNLADDITSDSLAATYLRRF